MYTDNRAFRWLSSKESTYNARDTRFNLWVEKIPWGREWQSTLLFLPGESQEQRKPGGLQSMGSGT